MAKIKTREEIREELRAISSKYSVSGALPDLIVDYLTYYIEQNQASMVSLGMEGNLDTAQNWDNIIALCGSLMYSVNRPALAKLAVPVWWMKNNVSKFSDIATEWEWTEGIPTPLLEDENFGYRFLDGYEIDSINDSYGADHKVNVKMNMKSFLDYFTHMTFDTDNKIYSGLKNKKHKTIAVQGDNSLYLEKCLRPDLTDKFFPIELEAMNPAEVTTVGFDAMAGKSRWVGAGNTGSTWVNLKPTKIWTSLNTEVHHSTGSLFQWTSFVMTLCGKKHTFEFDTTDLQGGKTVMTEYENLSSFSEPDANLKTVLVENYKDYSDRTSSGTPAIFMITTPGYGVKFIANEFVAPAQTMSIDLYEYVEPSKELLSEFVISGDDWSLDLGRNLDNVPFYTSEGDYLNLLDKGRELTIEKNSWYSGKVGEGKDLLQTEWHKTFFSNTNDFTNFFTMHTASVAFIDVNQHLETKEEAKRRAWTTSRIKEGILDESALLSMIYTVEPRFKGLFLQDHRIFYSNDDGQILTGLTDLKTEIKGTPYWIATYGTTDPVFIKCAEIQLRDKTYGDDNTLVYTGNQLSTEDIAEIFLRAYQTIVVADSGKMILEELPDSINAYTGAGAARLQQLLARIMSEYGATLIAWRPTLNPAMLVDVKVWDTTGVPDVKPNQDMNNGSSVANQYIVDGMNNAHAYVLNLFNSSIPFVWQP